ncbi:MAG: hypothetical protein AAFS10_10840, partial [Myxococcota bacterium]
GAGWLLGELEPKAWQTVAATDPETMLLSDVDQRSEAERTLLVQSLLDAYEAGRTDEAIGHGDSVHRQRLGLLNHEGQLHNHNPGNHALRVHVQRAARSARQNTWSPPTFAMLLQMAQDPARRVVYDQRHLLGVVEALLDESTLNHLLDVRDFWERVPDDRFRPITLTKTRRQLYDFLEDQLATRIVNRSHVRIVPEGPRFRLETSTDAHEALEQIEGVCWSNTNDELYTETERREAEIALVIVACFGGHVWSRQARHTSHQRLHTHEQITRELRACFHDVTVCSVNLAWSEGWGDLKQNLTWGGVLENALDAAGVDVVEMWSQGQHTRWFLRGRWPERLREQFGVSEDVLYVATNEEVRKKLTRLAKAEMQQSEHLDQDLLIVASASDDVERQLEMVPGARGQWLAWPVVEDGFMTEMEELLWQGMPGFDVFNRTTVVRGNQMFGREDGLANARRLLLRGESLGVFGLRKVGKTSFVRALTDAWDPGSQNLYTQPQSETQPWPETLVLWHDAQQLLSYDEMSWLRQMSDVFQRRMKHLTGFEDWPTEPSWAHWQDGLKRVLERPDQRVCVVVDEFDLLFEGPTRVEIMLRFIRGLSQESQGRITAIFIGRDPTQLTQPEIGGVTNPMLAWLHELWLGPLEHVHADELLTTLGARVGMQVGPQACHWAWRWSGGHPTLHRMLGSALMDASQRQTHSRPSVTDTEAILNEAEDIYIGDKTRASELIPNEVHALLSRRYPDQWDVFQRLLNQAHGPLPASTWRRLRTLRNFGLVKGSRTSCWIPETFRSYMEAFVPKHKTHPQSTAR